MALVRRITLSRISNITQLLDIESFLNLNNELGKNSKEETLLQVINHSYGDAQALQTPEFPDRNLYGQNLHPF